LYSIFVVFCVVFFFVCYSFYSVHGNRIGVVMASAFASRLVGLGFEP